MKYAEYSKNPITNTDWEVIWGTSCGSYLWCRLFGADEAPARSFFEHLKKDLSDGGYYDIELRFNGKVIETYSIDPRLEVFKNDD